MGVCLPERCRCITKHNRDGRLCAALGQFFECACRKRGHDGRCTVCRAKVVSVREFERVWKRRLTANRRARPEVGDG